MQTHKESSNMRSVKALLMGSAALACVGMVPGTANAQSFAFGAGATFPSIAYRQLMDCLYKQLQGSPGKPGPLALNSNCTAPDAIGYHGLIFYAPTGSGNGKAVLLSNNVATIGTPSGSAPWTDNVSYPFLPVNSPADYDGVQFAGSDDIITSGDVANWAATGANNAPSAQAKFGNLIQLPSLVGPVAIGFQGKDASGASLNILPATPTGGSSGLNLTRQAMCGIMSGHITQWDNAILTASNGGVLGHGNITVVHRQDGSGTTFLLTNALVEQCRFVFGPTSETVSTVVSYAFPWTYRNGLTDTCPTANPLYAKGSNIVNWPDQFPTDQCGNAVTSGGHFANASGSGALVSMVSTTNGAVGYASADFWLPVKSGGLPAANIQSQWDLTSGNGLYEPPTPTGAITAMNSVTPIFDDTTRVLPLAWSLQGVAPNPGIPAAYPISGFTWLEMYQCYQPHSNTNNAFLWFRTWIDFLYGSSTATAILNSNGFHTLPYPWLVEAYKLLNSASGPAFTSGGGSSAACTGKVGAY